MVYCHGYEVDFAGTPLVNTSSILLQKHESYLPIECRPSPSTSSRLPARIVNIGSAHRKSKDSEFIGKTEVKKVRHIHWGSTRGSISFGFKTNECQQIDMLRIPFGNSPPPLASFTKWRYRSWKSKILHPSLWPSTKENLFRLVHLFWPFIDSFLLQISDTPFWKHKLQVANYQPQTTNTHSHTIDNMGCTDVLSRKSGVIVGDDVLNLFKYAQEHNFAIPAIVRHDAVERMCVWTSANRGRTLPLPPPS